MDINNQILVNFTGNHAKGTWTFAVAFNNKLYSSVACPAAGSCYIATNEKSKTSCNVGTSSSTTKIDAIAIGY